MTTKGEPAAAEGEKAREKPKFGTGGPAPRGRTGLSRRDARMSSGVVYVPDDEEIIEDEAPLATTHGEPLWTAKTIENQVSQALHELW